MKKEYLVTDFFHLDEYDNKLKKRFLEIPTFDENNILKKNTIYKKWKSREEKIKEHNENVELLEHFLEKLTIHLNKYHKKNYSRRYWKIILTPWLWWFISSVSFIAIIKLSFEFVIFICSKSSTS